jgi:hypothetical protein
MKPISSSHVSIIMGALGLDVGNLSLMLEVATCNCHKVDMGTSLGT